MRVRQALVSGVTGLRRNLTMTAAMILTTALSLTFLGSALILVHKVDTMKRDFDFRVEVSIYLADSTTRAQRDALQRQLVQDPLVRTVTYENKQQAYAQFQKLFKQAPDLVNNTGPSDIPASFRVKLKDPAQSALATEKYKAAEGVEDVRDQRQFLEPLFAIISGIQLGAGAAAAVALVAAVLLIGNTIQVAAFSRRREIEVMRLVGASSWYVQLPFVVEALFAGILGAVLAVGFLVGAKAGLVDGRLSRLLALVNIPQLSYADILWPVAPQLLLIATVLSALTAWVTLRFYVRV